MIDLVKGLLWGGVAGPLHPDDDGIDSAGWLHGPLVSRLPAHPSWFGAPLESVNPIAIVWHYTHTGPGTAKTMAKRRTRRRDPRTDRAASWHFTIDTDGSIWQMVSCLDSAWHCAKGSIAPKAGAKGIRVNRCTVGIEIVGDGKAFTGKQVGSAALLVEDLVDAYGLTRANCARNHSEFDPTRRKDAGPVWNGKHLPGILDVVFKTR